MSFWEKFKEDMKEQAQQQLQKKQEHKERLKQMDKEGIAYCPKCTSTSIQYVERRKKLSVGRGMVGGALLGPIGAGVGAVTSKKYKGFVKCLNCGHQWKM